MLHDKLYPMKKLCLVALIAMFCSPIFAQTVVEGESFIAGGKRNVIIGTIPKGDVKAIEKNWKSLMKKYKAKLSGKDEIFADNAIIKPVYNNSMDVYARVETINETDVRITIAFDMGDYYMSSSQQPELFKETKIFIEKFVMDQSKTAYKENLKSEEKVLSGMIREQKKMENENKKLDKKNEDLRKQIRDNQQIIKDNQTAIENKVRQISRQEQKVKSLKSEKPK